MHFRQFYVNPNVNLRPFERGFDPYGYEKSDYDFIIIAFFIELLTRIELVTSSLPRKCSTTELQQQRCIICANLPRGWSGRRDSNPRPLAWKANALPTELLPQKLSVGGDGFEPPKSKTADLQSAPFGHSGIRPDN